MAIAVDSTSSAALNGTPSPTTWSHTCTGTNLALFVAVMGPPDSGAFGTVTVTYKKGGITTNLTKIGSEIAVDNGTADWYVSLWYMLAPDTGANNITVSTSYGGGGSGECAAVSYTGVLQSGMPDSTAGANSAGSNVASKTFSTTVVLANCWTILAFRPASATDWVAGAGTTLRKKSPAGNGVQIFDSNAVVGTGSQSLIAQGTSDKVGGVMASFAPAPVTRFWVGGSGNWDAATTTHWSASTGGATGASVPTSLDTVTLDGSSGGGTATITATANCLNLVCTGYTGTLAGSSALNIYGSLTAVSGMGWTHTGTLTFASTSSGKTITTNTKTITSVIVFDGVGGGWTFQDAFTSTGTSVTLTNGSVNLNNLSHSFAKFASANTNTRVFTMGSGTLSLSDTGTVWDTSTITNLTLTINTSTIKLTDTSSSSKTFSGGGKTFYNFYITGAGTGAYTIVGSNTFNDFKVDTPPHTVNFTAGTTQTVSSWTVTGTVGNLITLQSTSTGTQWILASTSVLSSDYISLQDSKATKL